MQTIAAAFAALILTLVVMGIIWFSAPCCAPSNSELVATMQIMQTQIARTK